MLNKVVKTGSSGRAEPEQESEQQKNRLSKATENTKIFYELCILTNPQISVVKYENCIINRTIVA